MWALASVGSFLDVKPARATSGYADDDL